MIKNIGSIQINCTRLQRGMIRIGFGGSFALGNGCCSWWNNSGKIIFYGKASIGRGSTIVTGKNGSITFGINFEGNANCIYNSSEKIEIGDNCLIGWGTTIIDGDGHVISNAYGNKKKYAKITIGNHVWICSDVKILKNTSVADESIVASNATLSKQFSQSHLMVGGCNKVLDQNVVWER